jgi:DNA-binding GntR family transcriptional regulator
MKTFLNAVVRAEPLGDRVYSMLREHIRAGSIPAGQPMQEATLAEQLSVSRTPVREALSRLAMEGLVVQSGRGFIIPVLSDQDIEDIYELRFLLEPGAARTVAACVRKNPDRLTPIRAALDDLAAANKAGDGAAFMEANYRYRNSWTALIPNRRLVRAIELYSDHVRFLRAFSLDDGEVRNIVLEGLKKLAAAFQAGDGAEAARALRAHLARGKEILLSMPTSRDRSTAGSVR